MSKINKLIGLLLRQSLRDPLGREAESLDERIRRYFEDPNHELSAVVQKAHERTWQTLRGAVGNLSADRPRGAWVGDELDAAEVAFLQSEGGVAELTLVMSEVAQALSDSHIYSSLKLLIQGAQHAVAELSEVFQNPCPKLAARMVALIDEAGTPSLIAVLSFHLHAGMAHHPHLHQDWQQAILETLSGDLKEFLTQGDDETAFQEVSCPTPNTLVPPETTALMASINEYLSKIGAVFGPLGPEHSGTLTIDQSIFIALTQGDYERFNSNHGFPEMRDSVARLFMGIGHYQEAARNFSEFAAHNPKDMAQAHFNAFRAHLEQRSWGDALASLQAAINCDPITYAPCNLEKYALQKIVSANGLMVVYQAEHRASGQLKEIQHLNLALFEEGADMIANAVQKLNDLHHRALPFLDDWGFSDEAKQNLYLISPWFESVSLAEDLDRALWDAESVRELARQLAAGMTAAHSIGILHGDLKPSCIRIQRNYDRFTAKIAGFGLGASFTAPIIRTVIDRHIERSVLMDNLTESWQHASPEKRGELSAEMGTHSDVYSFGGLLCTVLFKTPKPAQSDWQNLTDEGLKAVLQRCLERYPHQRFQSFEAVLSEVTPHKLPPHMGMPPAQRKRPSRTDEATRAEDQIDEGSCRNPIRAEIQHSPALTQCLITSKSPTTLPTQKNPQSASLPLPNQTMNGLSQKNLGLSSQGTAKDLRLKAPFRDLLKMGKSGPEMTLIPTGTFEMGSPPDERGRRHDEKRRQVRIENPFALGIYTVSFDEYDVFCQATSREPPSDHAWGRGSLPVINVSWHDALAYCAWLSDETGKNYRLPTEAEWEYTCRAGTTTPFWWGKEIYRQHANYRSEASESQKRTVKVKKFAANPWGLYQMHGNVWEWCSCDDLYNDNALSEANSGTKAKCVERGGSWNSSSDQLRAAHRNHVDDLTKRAPNAGFRVARDL